MSSEHFTRFMNDLTNKHIFELVNSQVVHEKIGGIMAIGTHQPLFTSSPSLTTVNNLTCIVVCRVPRPDKLIDIEHDENAKTTRLANYLRLGLQSNDPTVMTMAAKALGRLAQASGTLTAVFVVEFEVKRALEWLQDATHQSRRYAAVLVLKELAENAPTLFYVHVSSFFDLVWYYCHPLGVFRACCVRWVACACACACAVVADAHAWRSAARLALHDTNASIREGAVDALHAALALISERENRLRLQWYHKIYEEAQKGLRLNTVPTIHGSLITLGTPFETTATFRRVAG